MVLFEKGSSERYGIEDLKGIMAQLRSPEGGCPWDRAKDFKSIAPYTIEEAYEVVDAIDRGDMEDLQDELGDLLFQVIFHAQLASEETVFAFDDVVHTLSEKLIRRHPHVFGDETLASDDEIRGMWERVKGEERLAKASSGQEDAASLLDDVPVAMPALSRAVKLQKQAAKVGFDWPSIGPVMAKIDEELGELKEALRDDDGEPSSQAHIAEELGDLMFVMANLARHLRIDPERAVRDANLKFCRRFNYIERTLIKQERSLDSATLEEMDALWDEAKRLEKLED